MIHIVSLNTALDRTIILESFRKNGVNRAKNSKNYLGGKGFNVIRSFLVDDVVPFRIHTFLGGFTGDFLLNSIKEKDISASITPIKGMTRICSIIVDEDQNNVHVINEEGPFIGKDEKEALFHSLINQVGPDDYVVFSGSLPQGLDNQFYKETILILQEKGAKCVLDSSGSFLEEGVKANPWLIKINEFEFLDLLGKEPRDLDLIEIYLKEDTTYQNVIVTLGKKGTIAKFNDKIYRVSLPSIEAKNATASGDIYLGALIKCLYSKRPIEEALKTASAYSLSNCFSWFPQIDNQIVKKYEAQISVSLLRG